MKKKDFCIVTPFHKKTLNDYEKICLNTIQKVFKNEDKYLITFDSNNLCLKNFEKIIFRKSYFKSIQSYNQLCLSYDFYEKFTKYRYILICHLDVIVLSKSYIYEMINKEISYIGAPSGKKSIFDRSRKKLWGRRFFCNGGFSLRNVNDFLRVLSSDKLSNPINYYSIYECLKSGFGKYLALLYRTKKQKEFKKADFFTKNFYLHEDSFWTYFAKIFYREFKLPSITQTNNFAFDGDPYFFYKKNGDKLPVALHGHHDYLNFLNNLKLKIN